MKNKSVKIVSAIIGVLILIINIFYRNNYIVKNNKQIIKEMDENTQVNSLNSTINELNKAHEEYQAYIQNCKTQIATALTNEGVTTSNDATLETMTNNISKVLQARTSGATATKDDIKEGKTAWVNGKLIVGSGSFITEAKESMDITNLVNYFIKNHAYYTKNLGQNMFSFNLKILGDFKYAEVTCSKTLELACVGTINTENANAVKTSWGFSTETTTFELGNYLFVDDGYFTSDYSNVPIFEKIIIYN